MERTENDNINNSNINKNANNFSKIKKFSEKTNFFERNENKNITIQNISGQLLNKDNSIDHDLNSKKGISTNTRYSNTKSKVYGNNFYQNKNNTTKNYERIIVVTPRYKNKKSDIILNKKKEELIENINTNIKNISNFVQVEEFNKNVNKEDEIHNVKTLNLGFFKYYSMKFLYDKKNNQDKKNFLLFNLAKEKIKKKFDVINYIKYSFRIKNFMTTFNPKN